MSISDEIKRLLPIGVVLGTSDKRICCPLPQHDDRSPSCEVDHDRGLFHCMACGEGGDIFSLTMARERCDFREALKKLAEMAGVKLEKGSSQKAKEEFERRKRIQAARLYAVDYYHKKLLENPAAMEYWQGRGLSEKTIRDARLGWSDGYLTRSVKNKNLEGLTLADFVAAGLIRERDGKHSDTFYDYRYIIPMVSRGQVINITGRKSDLSRGEQKYLHLQGEHGCFFNEDAIGDLVWLFEGHPDTLAGIEIGLPAVGVVGTQGLTQPEKLRRCRKIFICADNDDAGQAAADIWAAAIMRENPDADLLYVNLPPGVNDFNDWMKANRGDNLQAAFELLKAAAKPPIEYKISRLQRPEDLRGIWGMLAPLSEVARDKYFQAIKQQLPGVSISAIRKEFKAWQMAQAARDLAGHDVSVVDVDFSPKAKRHLNIDFEFAPDGCSGHVCMFAAVKRQVGKDETTQVEPILIRSTIDPQGAMKTARVFHTEMVGMDARTVPMRSIVEGRWSSASIERFLSGEMPPPNTAALVRKICAFLQRYIWFKDTRNHEVLAFYAMGTYAARIFGSFPYLAINGLKRTGKSNTLELMYQLCFNAMLAVNATIATTFRSIQSSFPTWIRDEAEQFNKITPENQEELTILNSGYKQGTRVQRMEKIDGDMVLGEYEVFSPKIFGGINVLNSTLMDRGILIKSHRAPKDIVAKMPRMNQQRKRWEAEAADLRDELHCWVLSKFHLIQQIFEQYPPIKDIGNREWELWLPLLTLAFLADEEADGSHPEATFSERMIALAIDKGREKEAQEEDDSMERLVLQSLYRAFEDFELSCFHPEYSKWFPSKQVAAKVTEIIKEDNDLKYDVSQKKLIQILEQTGVITDKTKQIDRIKAGGKRAKCVNITPEKIREALQSL